jgi:SAM-dependent methyltransferase
VIAAELTDFPDGAYDALYGSVRQLWSDTPGRMIDRAAAVAAPGQALDLGCGDGRNALWLEQRGWVVEGFDVSAVALEAAAERFRRAGHRSRGGLFRGDAAQIEVEPTGFDLALVYGLYHCLSDEQMLAAHRLALGAVRPGGLIAFSALDDRLPVPAGHGTGKLWLRNTTRLRELFDETECLAWEEGEIHEEHPPVIGPHRHSALWALARVR